MTLVNVGGEDHCQEHCTPDGPSRQERHRGGPQSAHARACGPLLLYGYGGADQDQRPAPGRGPAAHGHQAGAGHWARVPRPRA